MTWWLWLLIGIATGGIGLIIIIWVALARELNHLDRRMGMPHRPRRRDR